MSESEGLRFEYDGEMYDLVLEKIDLDEAVVVKDLTGFNYGPALKEAAELNPHVLSALALVSIRRKRPDVTIENIGNINLLAFAGGEEDKAEQSPPAVEDAA